jgi:hypothetical protein
MLDSFIYTLVTSVGMPLAVFLLMVGAAVAFSVFLVVGTMYLAFRLVLKSLDLWSMLARKRVNLTSNKPSARE